VFYCSPWHVGPWSADGSSVSGSAPVVRRTPGACQRPNGRGRSPAQHRAQGHSGPAGRPLMPGPVIVPAKRPPRSPRKCPAQVAVTVQRIVVATPRTQKPPLAFKPTMVRCETTCGRFSCAWVCSHRRGEAGLAVVTEPSQARAALIIGWGSPVMLLPSPCARLGHRGWAWRSEPLVLLGRRDQGWQGVRRNLWTGHRPIPSSPHCWSRAGVAYHFCFSSAVDGVGICSTRIISRRLTRFVGCSEPESVVHRICQEAI
jgi:hypothetical protein